MKDVSFTDTEVRFLNNFILRYVDEQLSKDIEKLERMRKIEHTEKDNLDMLGINHSQLHKQNDFELIVNTINNIKKKLNDGVAKASIENKTILLK